MTHRTRLNLALAAVAAVLGGLLWFSQPQPPATPEPLLDIARADIRHIEIHTGGGVQPIVLEREQGQWRLSSPVTARANENRIDTLLAMARITPQRRLPAGAIKAGETGLDQPLATIRFNNGPALSIGAYAPLKTQHSTRYVRAGDTVALAPVPNAGLLDLSWPQWISPRLLAGDAELVSLRLPQATLSRADTGGWQVSPADQDRGADAAQFTVDAWHHAAALTISQAQDKPAQANVRLTFADGHARSFEVLARDPQLILRDPRLGIAYRLNPALAPALLDMRHPASALADGDTANPRQRETRHSGDPGRRDRP